MFDVNYVGFVFYLAVVWLLEITYGLPLPNRRPCPAHIPRGNSRFGTMGRLWFGHGFGVLFSSSACVDPPIHVPPPPPRGAENFGHFVGGLDQEGDHIPRRTHHNGRRHPPLHLVHVFRSEPSVRTVPSQTPNPR